jgi:hypothetical protein
VTDLSIESHRRRYNDLPLESHKDMRALRRAMSPDEARAAEPWYSPLREMNEEWFLLDEHGDLSVCRFTTDDATGRERLDRYTPAAFRLKYAASVLGPQPLAEAWLEWPGHRSFDRVAFAPGKKVPDGVLNLYRGLGVVPQDGQCYRIEEHLMDVVCDWDADLCTYLLKWMARMVQQPDGPGEVAIVLRGKEGCGKSVVGRLLRRIMGAHGITLSSPKHLVGEFNGHLENAVFVEASEALFAGDKQVASKLKALVTDETLIIEQKGRDAREVKNRVHLLMTSNEDWVVPAGPESRRWLVIDVSDKRRGDAAYFKALWAEINDDDAVGAFLHQLLAEDLSDFNVRDFPKTEALVDQRAHSVTGILAWALDLVSRGCVVKTEAGSMSWREFFATRELFADYREWVAGQRFERALTAETFGRDLNRTLGLERVRRAPAALGGVVPLHAQDARGFMVPATPAAFDRLVRERAGLGCEEN